MFNGAATFITLVEQARRPHEVRFELPPVWKQTMTALEPAADGQPNHYRAEDYDTLVDSPIVAGNPSVHEFEVDGSKHLLVDIGETRIRGTVSRPRTSSRKSWRRTGGSGASSRSRDTCFSNVFRQGGGGLEHKNSTLLTAAPPRAAYPARNFRWLSFVSHEYFHAFNVKRLRPVELGPFDYEHPPTTSSLWIAEGLTSYYGDLIVVRAGLGTTAGFPGGCLVAHRAASKLAGPAGAVARAIVARRLVIRHVGRRSEPRQDGRLLREGTDRGFPARRQNSARNRRARRAWMT